MGVPVDAGRSGIAIFAGVNHAAAMQERGIDARTISISSLIDFRKMEPI
jgi:repressor of nif and glnA expression